MAKETEKIRLDNGLEYEAAPEVAVYVEKLKNDAKDAKAEYDALQAKYDAALADNKKVKEDAEQAKKDTEANFDAAVAERVGILKKAADFKVDGAETMSNDEIKRAVIKSVRGDSIDLTGKSADYIAAAYDLCQADEQRHDASMAEQRKTVNKQHDDAEELSPAEKYRRDMAELYTKEVK